MLLPGEYALSLVIDLNTKAGMQCKECKLPFLYHIGDVAFTSTT